MQHVLASGLTLSSAAGNVILLIVAAIAFIVAAVLAWLVEPRARWATAVSVGLLFLVLAFLFGG